MADIANKYAENVSGKFYVDDQCIDCDLCRETAPVNFTRSDDGGYSYVFKQPTTPEEEALCKEAMEGCPVEAIGNNAKAEGDRTMTMNCLAKPTQRTGKPEAPARASPIYRKEETERFRPTSTRKPKQNAKASR